MGKNQLNILEKKFCKCLIKVRAKSLKKNKIINPYGICTKSVYLTKGLKRTKKIKCLKLLNLSKMTFKELKAYAIEKKIPIRNKGKFVSKQYLINKLNNYKIKKL